ncbi:MAG: HAMP domain-containing histidine kinase [Saprospiraceae bacterium]|nr:HAMP domain-containing histidine kinase [Saprospiraceae bacterium]
MRRLAILLITLGFGLLLAFVYLFLKKVWEDEVDSLKQQTNLLLVNAVRSIEQNAFDNLIVRTLDVRDDSVQVRLNLQGSASYDSLIERDISIKDKTRFEYKRIQIGDSVQVWESNTLPKEVRIQPGGTVGSLSMIVAIQGDSMHTLMKESLKDPAARQVLPLLKKKFVEALQAEGNPIPAQMVQLKGDSTTSGLLAATYLDALSGEKYGAVIDGYQQIVLKRMWPQVLFSLLLLLCVGLAFLFIYQSLLRQSRLTELKNDFIRNMTHELKTPIATVSVAVEALQNFDALQNPERTREYLDIAGIELNRLSLLVDKVLRVSMFEKQEPELRREPLDLQLLVQDILHSMRLQFEKCRARVQFQPEPGGYLVSGDRLHLSSVVYNLLDNALKYGSEHPEIEVQLSQQEGQLSLRVRDNGIGIPAAYQDRIFEKFFRVPTGDVHTVKGHGLGLSYVAGVVRLHGGSIGVESREQQGTTFTILLPLQQPAA